MDNHTDPTPENIVENAQTSIAEVLPENTAVTEPILEDNPNRFVLFPIEHNDIWSFYKKSEASFWTAEEIDLAADIVDRGVMLTGGGALLGDLDLALREQTGLAVSIADDSLNCVALGTGKALEFEKQLRHAIDYDS